jgi:hypothetical protein
MVSQLLEADRVIKIIKLDPTTVDGCEQALEITGQRCAGLIHRYLDSNLRF